MKYSIRLIRALPLALALIVLASCGNVGSSSDASAPSGSGPAITVGSKNFTEQYILGNMYALAVVNAGFARRPRSA